MSKQSNPEEKGKKAKADKATAPKTDKAAKGTEATSSAPVDPPEVTEGTEVTKDGFRADCYEKICKGITKDTKMIVTKQRYRLGDGTNKVAGDEFVAGDMDARIILSAMNSFHIVPVEHKQLDGEHRQVFVARMMKIYAPDVAPSTCDKKK